MNKLSAERRLGFVGVDVDSLHHYYPGQASSPERSFAKTENAVYEYAIPRYLELFDNLNIRCTFFVIAKDVENPLVRQRLHEITACGHEVASHSYSHPQHFIRLAREAKANEIVRAEEILQQATGMKVCGFRAPAWGIDELALDILEEREYLYDSSIMPTYWLPILKVGYSLKSRGSVGSRDLLGHYRYSAAPLQPYHPDANHIERRGMRKILELPIAVVPLGRAPFWATVHLAANCWRFFRFCYQWVHKNIYSLHYECHAIDLLDLASDKIPSSFHHMFGLKHSFLTRRNLLKQILECIRTDYQLVTARELSQRVQTS